VAVNCGKQTHSRDQKINPQEKEEQKRERERERNLFFLSSNPFLKISLKKTVLFRTIQPHNFLIAGCNKKRNVPITGK